MEELVELRDYINRNSAFIHSKGVYYMNKYIDYAEQAISDRYMELPVDADGKPWRVGDKVEYPNGKRDVVRFITVNDSEPTLNECGWIPGKCRHIKPDTIEDVLRGLVALAEDTSGGRLDDGDIEGFADEIRRMVRDDR